MKNICESISLCLWVIVATCSAGEYSLRFLRLTWANRVQRFVFAGSIGLGFWLLILFWVGWLFAYTRMAGLGITVIFTLPVCKTAVDRFRARGWKDIRLGLGKRGWLLIGLSTAVIVLGILAAFAPVAGMADALTYHLNLPKEFIRAGRIYALPYDPNSVYPLLLEIGFGFGLFFGNASFANLLAVWITILLAIAIYGWALEKSSALYSLLGVCIFLFTPAVYNHMNTPYVDLALSLFSLLAFWSFCGWIRTGEVSWVGLCGCFCGFALGTKYLALAYALVLLGAIIWEIFRRKLTFGESFYVVLLFAFFGAVIGFVWYARSSWVMGNPVYPYLRKVLGGFPSVLNWQMADRTYGVGYDLRHLLTLFWDATFYPEAYAGFGTRWNLLFLGLFPLVIWYVVRGKGGWLATFAITVLLSWFYLSQVMRFFMPFFPLYCVLIAWSCQGIELFPLAVRRVIWTWVALVCFWEIGCMAIHAKPQIKAIADPTCQSSLLRAKERSYGIAEWTNSHQAPSAKILSDAEINFYYFKPLMVREPILRLFTNYPEKLTTDAEVIGWLLGKGFTHVLISDNLLEDRTKITHDSLQKLTVRKLVEQNNLFSLLHEETYDSPTEKIRYRLYKILGGKA